MADNWYLCKVLKAGPTESGDVSIMLQNTTKEPHFTHWLKAAPEARREMLSVALTAMSTGYKVEADIPEVGEGKLVQRLYMTLGT